MLASHPQASHTLLNAFRNSGLNGATKLSADEVVCMEEYLETFR